MKSRIAGSSRACRFVIGVWLIAVRGSARFGFSRCGFGALAQIVGTKAGLKIP
jgi:hypothetical protein